MSLHTATCYSTGISVLLQMILISLTLQLCTLLTRKLLWSFLQSKDTIVVNSAKSLYLAQLVTIRHNKVLLSALHVLLVNGVHLLQQHQMRN